MEDLKNIATPSYRAKYRAAEDAEQADYLAAWHKQHPHSNDGPMILALIIIVFIVAGIGMYARTHPIMPQVVKYRPLTLDVGCRECHKPPRIKSYRDYRAVHQRGVRPVDLAKLSH